MTEICRNMIEGDRAASRLLCQSPVNVIVIPLIMLINMLKTVNDYNPANWENHALYRLFDTVVAGPGKIPPTESGNGKRGSNVMSLAS